MASATARSWNERISEVEPAKPTMFQRECEKLGLQDSPELWRYSKPLETLCKANSETRYIPEFLLAHFRISVSDDF